MPLVPGAFDGLSPGEQRLAFGLGVPEMLEEERCVRVFEIMPGIFRTFKKGEIKSEKELNTDQPPAKE